MRRFLDALRNRSFLFLWLAEIFSQLAMNMLNFILILVAFKLTHSNTAVSGVVLSFTVPAILFGIVAGVLVDRWNKKDVLLWSNLGRAALLVVLAFVHTNLVGLYGLTFVIAIVTQFFIPAETPMIPLLVKRHQLIAANALFSVALYGSMLVAYALSGPFVAIFAARRALLILAGFFSLAAVSVAFVRSSARSAAAPGPGGRDPRAEVRQTIGLIVREKNLYNAFSLYALAQTLVLVIAVIGPGYASHILGIPVESFPLLFVTPAVLGMGAGTLLVTNLFHDLRKQTTTNIGLFLSALAVFLMPYGSRVAARPLVQAVNAHLPRFLQVSVLHFLILLAFALGIAITLVMVPSNTIIQEETSDDVRGKIYGALSTVVSLLSLIPVAVVGSLADLLGVGTVLTMVALVIALIGVLSVVRVTRSPG